MQLRRSIAGFGVAVGVALGLGTLDACVQASSFSIVHDFSVGATNGGGYYYVKHPIEGSDHRLYGTTSAGGSYSNGTVFRLERDGSGYTALHSFLGQPTDGASPEAGVIEGSDGKLYGTTISGGAANRGTIFRLNLNGSGYEVVHHFSLNPSDGNSPRAALLEGSDGRLYGTTYGGGTNGQGTVFALNKHGSGFVVIRSLLASTDDAGYPEGPLIEGNDGALYGASTSGGILNSGALFRLQKDGTYAVLRLYSNGASEGTLPRDALLEGADGRLYGTTRGGGTSNAGTVFRIAKNGSAYTVLHHFAGGVADGRTPDAALVEGRDGLLYSSTISGGAFDAGTLYRVSKDGSHFELLHHFTASGETGYHPNEGLVAAHDGALYGSAPGGHGVRDPKHEFGFIFRLGHQLGFLWNGSQAHLVATGIAGYTYAIQHSSDLAAWATLETVVMPEGGQFEKDYSVPQGNMGFFRLRVP